MEVPVDFGNLTTGKKIIEENFANWTSGNEIIDNFIREKQLKYGDVEDNSDDGEAVFEWIPYNELIDIKEIENNCFTKAKLKNGSLHYNRYNKEWIRRPYETVILRSLYDLQNVITDEFANKLESYLTYPVECYGISQNPDTRVYILVFDNKISNHYCKTCGNEYEGRRYKWCKQCQIDQIKNNFTNWDDRIIKLDDFIQNMQLIINNYNVFKWIPHNEFIIVKELGNYTLAMWKKDRKVYLKHQHNLQENTDEFLNMLGSSVTSKIVIGISQNPNTKVYLLVFNDKYFNKYCEKCGYEYVIDKWCKQCEISQLRNNFINWTSGNVKLDEFIQKMQLNINRSNDIIFEWIPYNEFIIINELENYTLAIWKKGPLYSNYVEKSERNSCVKVYLRNLREITDEVLNEVESYLINKVIFGISQNPDTKVYLLVFHIIYFDRYCEKCGNKYGKYGWCKQCQINQLKNNFTNENVNFNDFIQKMQLMINEYNDRIFEWIPYNEFIISNESENCTLAIWEQDGINSVRKTYEKVYLKHLEITDEFLNKIESYLNKCLVFGISQNPNTKVYVLVLDDKFFDYYCEKCDNKYEDGYGKWCIQCQINQLKSNFTNWTSGNIKLDDFIQKMQLNINNYNDKIFEWIPYNEVVIINKELGKHSTLAIWEKGSLYPIKNEKLIRNSHEKVYLKYMNNSQEITDEFLNKVESYLLNNLVSGISQNPDTKDYILVFNNYYIAHYCLKCENKYDENAYNYWCKSCEINRLKNDFADWTSGNEKIDDFIKKMQLKINKYDDMIFEWIPYNKFIGVKEIGNSVFATAIWKDGPLYYSEIRRNYKRESDEKVLLKYLNNSQNINHKFLNEILYSVEESYGVSQNPNTKDFVLVFKLKYYCENCGKKYNNQFELNNKSCMSCQTNHENNKISDLIQEMKLNIDHNSSDSGMIFEWIPYDQFNDIKEIGKGGFSTVYSAIWKDGLLSYCNIGPGLSLDYKWKRESNTKVALKCLHNSQNFLDEFINEVKAYPNQKIDNILKIYGISQNPTTKDYIMVLEYAEGGDFNSYLNKNYEVFDWFNGLSVLTNTIEGLNKIHQKQMVHRDFHIGNILFTKFTKFDQYHNENNESIDYVACISDMGLCKKIDDINETSIYGVMPYVAPEVLKGNPYTQAADIYSFGMIMYVIATGRQPFADCAHDGVLALKICNGIRPEINDKITPKCYIDLMKRCWDSNPDNRPNSIELKEFIDLFYNSLNQKFDKKEQIHHETETQFNETQEYRKENFLSIKNNQSTTHTQAIYTSRLLNSFTKNLSKYEDNFNNSTVEIIDFTT